MSAEPLLGADATLVKVKWANVAELADALDLGTGVT
jgi:hypothetical protein